MYNNRCRRKCSINIHVTIHHLAFTGGWLDWLYIGTSDLGVHQDLFAARDFWPGDHIGKIWGAIVSKVLSCCADIWN